MDCKKGTLLILGFLVCLSISGCRENNSIKTEVQPTPDAYDFQQTCKLGSHLWLYDVKENSKTCSVCAEKEDFVPSGYFLNPIQIEAESFKAYFNDKHILCAYDKGTYEKFNRSKDEVLVKSLLEDEKIFYVDVDTTCEILSDTNKLDPQWHIVITSGEFNGTECWTAMVVVVNESDVEFYNRWENDPNNPKNKEDSDSSQKVSTDNESTVLNVSDDYVGILDGTYFVGLDIPAGTYRLVPLYTEYKGYWKRCSDASGDVKSTLASDLFDNTTYVTVNSGEYLIIKRCSGALQN